MFSKKVDGPRNMSDRARRRDDQGHLRTHDTINKAFNYVFTDR
jgi:hypothetical protein